MTENRYILFHCPGTTDQSFFDANSRDNCCEPFIALKNRCAELGYTLEVTKSQDLDACKWIIFWDVPSMEATAQPSTREIYAEAAARGFEDRLTLMLSEPGSVCARNEDISAHGKFKYVFTWNGALADEKRYIRTYLPVTAVYPEVPTIPFSKKRMLVDISGNKASSHARELYSERRDTIRFFRPGVLMRFRSLRFWLEHPSGYGSLELGQQQGCR